MKEIKAFLSEDGQIHTDKIKALSRDFIIALRGVFQSSGANGNNSTTDMATIVSANSEKFTQIIHKYKTSINRAKKSVNQVATKIV